MFSVKKFRKGLGKKMKADEQLEALCEEFGKLNEGEKDEILEFSQALAQSVSEKAGDFLKTEAAPPHIDGHKRLSPKNWKKEIFMKQTLKTLAVLLAIAFSALLLGTCSSPESDGEDATITIDLGNGKMPGKGAKNVSIDDLTHVLKFTGPSGT